MGLTFARTNTRANLLQTVTIHNLKSLSCHSRVTNVFAYILVSGDAFSQSKYFHVLKTRRETYRYHSCVGGWRLRRPSLDNYSKQPIDQSSRFSCQLGDASVDYYSSSSSVATQIVRGRHACVQKENSGIHSKPSLK